MSATKTSDELRAEIVSAFNEFKPVAEKYHAYAEKVVALSEDFHLALLDERKAPEVEELVLVLTLDVRETPAKLERLLTDELVARLKRVIFNRNTGQIFLFA